MTLVVSNEAGQDSITFNDFVTIFETEIPNINISNTDICAGETVEIIAEGQNIESWLWQGNDISFDTPQAVSVSPTENETYILTTTDENGCISENTIDITVLELPTFELISENENLQICLNDDIVLMATNAAADYTYMWNGENLSSENGESITATPITSGIYEVIATDENGCEVSQSVEVLVNNPSVSILAESMVCLETEFSLTAIGEGFGTLTYEWTGEGLQQTTGETITAIISSFSNPFEMYGVTVTDEIGCQVSQIVEVLASVCDGIGEEESLKNEINIYPNPAENQLFVELKNEKNEPIDMRLYNVLGEMIYEKMVKNNLQDGVFTLDISQIPSGTYFLQIGKDASFVTKKMIISQ